MCGLRGARRYQTDVLGQARCATRLARAPCTPTRASPTGSAPQRSHLANRGWQPARMACGLPASGRFWEPRSHAWTHVAAFVHHGHLGHVWRRSSSRRNARLGADQGLENEPLIGDKSFEACAAGLPA